jgi:hypothetical protein
MIICSKMGLADSSCDDDGRCFGRPLAQTVEWIKYFVLKDPDYDMSGVGLQQFDDIFAASVKEYNSIMGTNNPDLSGFRAAGAKILSYHGLVSLWDFETMS